MICTQYEVGSDGLPRVMELFNSRTLGYYVVHLFPGDATMDAKTTSREPCAIKS
jgi:hypothetical protein